jgi:hypothetical protein
MKARICSKSDWGRLGEAYGKVMQSVGISRSFPIQEIKRCGESFRVHSAAAAARFRINCVRDTSPFNLLIWVIWVFSHHNDDYRKSKGKERFFYFFSGMPVLLREFNSVRGYKTRRRNSIHFPGPARAFGAELIVSERFRVRDCTRAGGRGHNSQAAAVPATARKAITTTWRIVKLPGTPARKGDPTPDRTHRRGGIMTIPATILPARQARGAGSGDGTIHFPFTIPVESVANPARSFSLL